MLSSSKKNTRKNTSSDKKTKSKSKSSSSRLVIDCKNKSSKSKSKSSSSTLTQEEKQKLINGVEKYTLPKGSILYRTQPVECNSIKCLHCEDTGKNGVYFGDGLIIPLGMILEYNKPMYLCAYETTQDIELYKGKYSFRELEPERFFTKYYKTQTQRDRNFVINVDPIKTYNHVDDSLLPEHELFENEIWNKHLSEKEYFITKKDIHKIKLVFTNTKITSVNEALKVLTTQQKMLEDEFST
tara:strand:+ start:85 stop:807 length:723 start_codon:yes stop_codon:yes gene_type:complete